MSFFSKLFHKDEKKEKPVEKKVEPGVVEKPFGKFIFAGDDPLEVGYEADLDWYEKSGDLYYQPVSVFIEVDVPGTQDASLGIERFARIFEDREQVDFKVKLEVTKHYLGDEGSILTDCNETMSREEFMEELKIEFIAFYRSGKRVYSLEFPWVRDDMDRVVVIFDEDDKATVMPDTEYHKNFMSIIYPEKEQTN